MTLGWRSQIGEWFVTYVRRHTGLVVLLVGALGLGIIAGALLAGAVDGADRIALARDVQSLVQSGEGNLSFLELLQTSLPRYLHMAGLLWLLGVTLVGFVGVPALMFWRGLVTGFSVGFLIDVLGWQGLVLSLAVIVPQNVIALTALMVGGSASVLFSLGLWQRRFHHFKSELMRFTGLVAATAAALVVAACLEAALGLALTKLAPALF
jgi:stage II sporulation protein M